MTANIDNILYPEISPYDQGFLAVSEEHKIYYEQSGNPAGKPVVFLHGGPGAGCGETPRRFFDPDKYRIVLFDQRGAGKSTPKASLNANTTWHLVADMESLREHLQIDRWQVFGGSWGSTLALAYAQSHSDRVTELVLRGIFNLRRKELTWFYQEGASRIFPDAWEQYLKPIPEVERGDLISAYYRRLTHADKNVQIEAAKAWSVWEGSTCFLHPDKAHIASTEQTEFAVAFARIECHYFVHGGFMDHENQLIEGVDRIRHIPAVIVQGRYDVVCPMDTAWVLHKAWPEADFQVIGDAGHSALEPSIAVALVQATNRFAG